MPRQKRRDAAKREMLPHSYKPMGVEGTQKVRGVDCHKLLAKTMGLSLPWGKTHGKVYGTVVPDLLVKDVDIVQIIDFQGNLG